MDNKEQALQIAAQLGSLSDNVTRLHEIGAPTTTIFNDDGLVEFYDAVIAKLGQPAASEAHPVLYQHSDGRYGLSLTGQPGTFTAGDPEWYRVPLDVVEPAASEAEPLVRYCPGCGSIGPVEGKYRDCCPDGSDARMIPQGLAEKCRETFKIAIKKMMAEAAANDASGAVPVGYATEWKPGWTAVYFDADIIPPGTPVYAAPTAQPEKQAAQDTAGRLALSLAIDAIENAPPDGKEWPVNWPTVLVGLKRLRDALSQSDLTAEDVERQYENGIHIGSGLPRATCPCGFCAKHRHGFNQAALSQQAAPGAESVPWENFPAYLIDHCEGDTITEEGLQRAVAGMLADPKYAAPAAEPAQEICQNCQGNGEIVTDWDRYKNPRHGDVGDEAVAECPECDGTGKLGAPAAEPEALRKARHDSAHATSERDRIEALAYWLDQQPFEPEMLSCAAATLRAMLERIPAAESAEPVSMRTETTIEHIARDIREGRFPERSERQMVPTPATPDAQPGRDWTEDGRYECKCHACGQTFVGHKRRVTCKLCAAPDAQDDERANLEDALEQAYWNFDAKRKGLSSWKGMPMSERDAFKTEARGIASRQPSAPASAGEVTLPPHLEARLDPWQKVAVEAFVKADRAALAAAKPEGGE